MRQLGTEVGAVQETLSAFVPCGRFFRHCQLHLPSSAHCRSENSGARLMSPVRVDLGLLSQDQVGHIVGSTPIELVT